MSQTDKYRKRRGQKYLCSNPNCRRVFSRPKIIRYYVCPTCQTLVDITKTEDQIEAKVASAAPKPAGHRRPEITEPDKSQVLVATDVQARSAQPTPEEPCASAQKEPETSKKTVTLEQAHTLQQETIEPALTHQPVVETSAVSPSSTGCQYGFGYLSQREKAEGIPDVCIECPKLLNCMLSKLHKTGESVKEIKKWYKV